MKFIIIVIIINYMYVGIYIYVIIHVFISLIYFKAFHNMIDFYLWFTFTFILLIYLNNFITCIKITCISKAEMYVFVSFYLFILQLIIIIF